jgi:hypothetical protein
MIYMFGSFLGHHHLARYFVLYVRKLHFLMMTHIVLYNFSLGFFSLR